MAFNQNSRKKFTETMHLHEAAANGELSKVKSLLRKGANIHSTDSNGFTSLFTAALHGHLKVTQFLLKKGALIDAKENQGFTTLIVAAHEGHLLVVETLIQWKADLNTANKEGGTALYFASKNGHIDIVNVLLKSGANINSADNNGFTPLIVAAQEGHLSVVETLIQWKADLNNANYEGRTALYIASEKGHIDIVNVLLKSGANINSADNNGFTPLIMAAQNGHLLVVEILIRWKADINAAENNEGATALFIASQNGHLKVVEFLLKSGANINAAINDGATALHIVSQNGHIDVLNILLKYGANINSTDIDGATALYIASQNGHHEVVEFLLKSGANINAATNTGSTALEAAAFYGGQRIVETLVENGADITIKTKTGYTATMCAAQNGHMETLFYLLEKGPKLNSHEYFTLLTIAASDGRMGIMKKLVKIGADFDYRDPVTNLSAEEFAHAEGQVDSAWLLHKETGGKLRGTGNRPEMEACKSSFGSLVLNEMKRPVWNNPCFYDDNYKAGLHDYHIQDEDGSSFLHEAVKRNETEVMKILLEVGTYPLPVTHDGITPLNLATYLGYQEAVQILEGHLDKFRRILIEQDEIQHWHVYTLLLRCITYMASIPKRYEANDAEAQKKKLELMKEVSHLILGMGSLECPPGHSIPALHLAITCNTRTIITLLLAAGINLCYTYDGFGPIETAAYSPDITTWVIVAITRAVKHKLQSELNRLMVPAKKLLVKGLRDLIHQLDGKEPWKARFSSNGNNSQSLNNLMYAACEEGVTMTSWWIWRAAGHSFHVSNNGKTPLLAALDKGHIHTAEALIRHMDANPFLADNSGRIPLDLLPQEKRKSILKFMFFKEFNVFEGIISRALEDWQEKEAINLAILALIFYTIWKRGYKSLLKNQTWRGICKFIITQLHNRRDKSKVDDDWKMTMIVIFKEILGIIHSEEKSNKLDGMIEMSDILKTFIEDYEVKGESDTLYSLVSITQTLIQRIIKDEDLCRNILGKLSDEVINDDDFDKLIVKGIRKCSEKRLPLFLHLFVDVGSVDVNIYVNDICKTTPIHHSAIHNNESAAYYLVSRGAQIDKEDKYGHTPAHFAYMNGHKHLGDYFNKPHLNVKNILKPSQMWRGYKKYLEYYKIDYDTIGQNLFEEYNIPEKLTTLYLDLFKQRCSKTGIKEAVLRAKVDYTKGESKVVKAAIHSYLMAIMNKIGQMYKYLEGELHYVGSSADDVRLITPDEYDVNIILKNLSCYPDGGCVIKLEKDAAKPGEKEERMKITVHSQEESLNRLLEGRNLLNKFYKCIRKCLVNVPIEDKRLKLVPPAIRFTQVGVNLTFSWQGKEYPLLFIDVDVVPTLKAPWPAELERPQLLPSHINEVYINTLGKNEWRFSFGLAENSVMKELSDDEKQVFLACKLLVSTLKTEGWMPQQVKDKYKYFEGKKFKMPVPKGFILKNAFFIEKEKIKDENAWKEEMLLQRMASIFKIMCVILGDESNEVVQSGRVKAYFGGTSQDLSTGDGADVIYKFLTKWLEDDSNYSGTPIDKMKDPPSESTSEEVKESGLNLKRDEEERRVKEINLTIQDVEQLLSSNRFFNHYQIRESPPDGHCLLYAVLVSVPSQTGYVIKDKEELIQRMIEELLDNETSYLDYIDAEHHKRESQLRKEFIEYLQLKKFNTSFGDVVPHVLANCLSLKFIIIEKDEQTQKYLVHSTGRHETSSSVILLKSGMHYDALVPTKPKETHYDNLVPTKPKENPS